MVLSRNKIFGDKNLRSNSFTKRVRISGYSSPDCPGYSCARCARVLTSLFAFHFPPPFHLSFLSLSHLPSFCTLFLSSPYFLVLGHTSAAFIPFTFLHQSSALLLLAPPALDLIPIYYIPFLLTTSSDSHQYTN